MIKKQSLEETLNNANASSIYQNYRNFYLNDPLYGESACLNVPPVPLLFCIYGVNLETEVAFITKANGQKNAISSLMLDKDSPVDLPVGYGCKFGVVFETPQTPQKIISLFQPEKSPLFFFLL